MKLQKEEAYIIISAVIVGLVKYWIEAQLLVTSDFIHFILSFGDLIISFLFTCLAFFSVLFIASKLRKKINLF